MARTGFDWHCACGKVHLRILPGRSREVTCYCEDCRRFARDFGEAEALDGGGGVELVQMTSDRIRIATGGEELCALRYTDRGPLRWYTRCCGTPLGGSFPTRTLPIAMLHRNRLDPAEALGPPLVVAHARSAIGPVARAVGMTPLVFLGVLGQVMAARITGSWRRSPFFNEDGSFRSEPEMRPRVPA